MAAAQQLVQVNVEMDAVNELAAVISIQCQPDGRFGSQLHVLPGMGDRASVETVAQLLRWMADHMEIQTL